MDPTPQKRYVKLPGRGTRGGIVTSTWTTLWMGDDHLIQVESARISEDYKRFYFKDIKAILVRKTRKWAITNWILSGIALAVMAIFGAISASMIPSDREAMLMAGSGIAAFILLGLAINLLMGPTCACHLMTPVQVELLPSLNRLRSARKVLRRIRAAVESVQGPLSEQGLEEVARRMAQPEAIPSGAGGMRPSQAPPLRPESAPESLRW